MLRRMLPVALLVALVGVGCGGDSTEPVEETTVPATEDTLPAATVGGDEVRLARDAIATWNTSDCDAFVDLFAAGGYWQGYPVHDEAVQQDMRFYMALGDTIVVEECEEGATEGRVDCRAVSSDDLSGSVGAVWDATWGFRIADGEVTSLWFADHDRSRIGFVKSMVKWVEEEHPDVFAATFAAPEGCSGEYNCYPGNWHTSPEAAAALLDLGPEFIAQSDDYSVPG